MANAGHPKGSGQQDKVKAPDKHSTASKGMAETPRGAGGTGDPEEADDADYIRPAGKGDVELGRSHGERKTFGDRRDT